LEAQGRQNPADQDALGRLTGALHDVKDRGAVDVEVLDETTQTPSPTSYKWSEVVLGGETLRG
jgi:hypothetical protein